MTEYIRWLRRTGGVPMAVAVLTMQVFGGAVVAFAVGILVTAWLLGW